MQKMSLQIAFIMPSGYKGSMVFRELLFLLRDSLVSLGHEAIIKANQLDPEKINILLGYHLLNHGDYLKDYRYVPYQLEQLDANKGWYSENVRLLLRDATEIWDYSETNLRFLHEQGVTAKCLPAGYYPSLEIVPHTPEKDVDVLFYGSINERRKVLLEKLSKHVRVQVLNGVFGLERDEWIGRSKIVLNIHFYEMAILESVRISYLLNNSCFVITENSADNPYAKVPLVTAPYENLIDTIHHYLAHEDERKELLESTCRLFRENYPMTDLLKPILEQLSVS